MLTHSKPISLLQIAPELREAVRKMPSLPIGNAVGLWLTRTVIKLLPTKQYAEVRFENYVTNQGIAVRVCIPTSGRTGAAVLWLHGGGMMLGRAAMDDQFSAATARQLGAVIVAVEYRLAPEFPFPAALDDSYDAWMWLQQTAQRLRIDPTRLAIGGLSAGGGLAASLVQRIHDAGGQQPVAQWLFSPMLDDHTAAHRELDALQHYIWDNRRNRLGWRAFLGTEPGAAHVPVYAVAARRQDLRGLPAAWIGTGEIELFFEENKTYAKRLQAAGVPTTLEVVVGAPHGFERTGLGTSLVNNYLSVSYEWLRKHLGNL